MAAQRTVQITEEGKLQATRTHTEPEAGQKYIEKLYAAHKQTLSQPLNVAQWRVKAAGTTGTGVQGTFMAKSESGRSNDTPWFRVLVDGSKGQRGKPGNGGLSLLGGRPWTTTESTSSVDQPCSRRPSCAIVDSSSNKDWVLSSVKPKLHKRENARDRDERRDAGSFAVAPLTEPGQSCRARPNAALNGKASRAAAKFDNWKSI
ncbi:uncharacterized protein LOC142775490 [Rhipicephalus microplus]|uniref:uncharacterized protein LOC142775490 n=1 Tax=Rhipicephalus microplus TaxID=6941 RepID=UPI003F6D8EFF